MRWQKYSAFLIVIGLMTWSNYQGTLEGGTYAQSLLVALGVFGGGNVLEHFSKRSGPHNGKQGRNG